MLASRLGRVGDPAGSHGADTSVSLHVRAKRIRCAGVRFDRFCNVLVHARAQLIEPPLQVCADVVGARSGQCLVIRAGSGASGFRPFSHADGDHSIHRDHWRCSGLGTPRPSPSPEALLAFRYRQKPDASGKPWSD